MAALLELAEANPTARARTGARRSSCAPLPCRWRRSCGRAACASCAASGAASRRACGSSSRRARSRSSPSSAARRRSSWSRSAACSGSAPSAMIEIGAASTSRPPASCAARPRGPTARGARHRAEARGADPRRARAGARPAAPRDPAAARPRADRRDRRRARRARRPATRGAGSTSRRASRWSSHPTTPPPRASASPPCPRSSRCSTPRPASRRTASRSSSWSHHTTALGTALVRATGPAEHLDALGPLPTAADEASLYARPRVRLPHRRSATARSSAAARAGGGRRPARRPARAHEWSDGRATVLEMGIAARARGYEYLAICDHTPNVERRRRAGRRRPPTTGRGDRGRQRALAPFRILRGVECDIRDDGSLDAPDDVLAELDWVQLSLHRGQRAPRRELTRASPRRCGIRPCAASATRPAG